jgi:predicted DNA-binding protein
MHYIYCNMKKSKQQIYISEDTKKELTKISKITGAPVAEIIRRSIDKYLTKLKNNEQNNN